MLSPDNAIEKLSTCSQKMGEIICRVTNGCIPDCDIQSYQFHCIHLIRHHCPYEVQILKNLEQTISYQILISLGHNPTQNNTGVDHTSYIYTCWAGCQTRSQNIMCKKCNYEKSNCKECDEAQKVHLLPMRSETGCNINTKKWFSRIEFWHTY
jgi:hypothetical protein